MATIPKHIDDLKPAPYNPRAMSDEQRAGLAASLSAFGDIGGLVFNTRSGYVVCGHQRIEILKGDGGRLEGEDGTLAIVMPNGDRFPIRVIDWDDSTERLANLEANNPHVAGEWTDDLGPLLEELERDVPEMLESLRLDKLAVEPMPDFGPVGENEQGRLDEKAKVTCPECGHEFAP